MKIKVCGMKYADNVQALLNLDIHYIGFIFYEKSARFVGDDFDEVIPQSIPPKVQKVGVFVNADLDNIQLKANKYHLDIIQLHGDESPNYCKQLHEAGYQLIKAFSVDEQFNFDVLNAYHPYCSFFLFDTKGKNYGGNGEVFDWSILEKYDKSKPYFLSGGIDLQYLSKIKKIHDTSLQAIDVNSKFEEKPGFKNINKVKKLCAFFQ